MRRCPFCGSCQVRIVDVAFKWERTQFFRGKCDACGAYGPPELTTSNGITDHEKSRAGAEAKWNERATTPETG